jgi:hypothetical protein
MMRRAFTLVELLVSVVVLLAIIAATARIFSSTSKVARLGEATADLQVMSTAVEKTIRRDVSRMARDGFMAIQCVAVRNDVNRQLYRGVLTATAPLLDPSRPPEAYLRCDQLVFVARGVEATRQYVDAGFGNALTSGEGRYFDVNMWGSKVQAVSEGSSAEQVVRVGHGLQLPMMVADPRARTRPDAETMTYGSSASGPVVPWSWQAPGSPSLTTKAFGNFTTASPKAQPTQPDARSWMLSRQVVLLADDQGAPATEQGPIRFRDTPASGFPMNAVPSLAQVNEAIVDYSDLGNDSRSMKVYRGDWIPDASLWPDRILAASRVDIASTSLRKFRDFLSRGPMTVSGGTEWRDGERLPWTLAAVPQSVPATAVPPGEVRARLLNSLFGPALPSGALSMEGLWGWPRAERQAPSMDRADLMVSAFALVGGCSSFQIDWTWADRTGSTATENGQPGVADMPPDRNLPRGIRDVPQTGLMLADWPSAAWQYANSTSPSDSSNRVSVSPIALSPAPPRVPWFGLPDTLFPNDQRQGVTMLAGGLASDKAKSLSQASPPSGTGNSFATPIRILNPDIAPERGSDDGLTAPVDEKPKATASDLLTVGVLGPPLDPVRVEGERGLLRPMGTGVPVFVYQAAFGFNGDRPVDQVGRSGRDVATATSAERASRRVMRSDYTPWPTALRFTYTLHDPQLALERGRTYQFVVQLPRMDSR